MADTFLMTLWGEKNPIHVTHIHLRLFVTKHDTNVGTDWLLLCVRVWAGASDGCQ